MPNGARDLSFGNGGYFIYDQTGDDDMFFTAALQDDGKILSGGLTTDILGYQSALIIRLDTSGHPDLTFNTTGVIIDSYQNLNDEVSSVLIQPDGKIWAMGYRGSANYDILMLRYLSTGAEDNTFGNSGHIFDFIGPESEDSYTSIIQSDNKVVSTGYYDVNGDPQFYIARYDNDSILNSSNLNHLPSNQIIYPVPARDRLYIHNIHDGYIAIITDINGRELYHSDSTSPIDISGLSPGIYFLRVTSGKSPIRILKFIKQ
jgi:uncharacterized delta-60 repeat protein